MPSLAFVQHNIHNIFCTTEVGLNSKFCTENGIDIFRGDGHREVWTKSVIVEATSESTVTQGTNTVSIITSYEMRV